MNKEIITKRLTFIKQLFKIGIAQSYQAESVAFFSILSFHDSIEMFLILLAEKKNIKSEKFNFMDYWEKIPDLTLKESMRNLNDRRKNIKHKGLLPAKSEIEISRVSTIEFFDQNTKAQFNIDFQDISLLELINYPIVLKYLKKSEKYLNESQFNESIENAAFAFDELITTYENNKSFWNQSPFFFGDRIRSISSRRILQSISITERSHDFEDFIDSMKESVQAIQKATKIMGFGIDYKEYAMFKILTPTITRLMSGQLIAEIMRKKKWTPENCQYCIDFVIDSALKLQEFDFDIAALEESPFNFKNK